MGGDRDVTVQNWDIKALAFRRLLPVRRKERGKFLGTLDVSVVLRVTYSHLGWWIPIQTFSRAFSRLLNPPAYSRWLPSVAL